MLDALFPLHFADDRDYFSEFGHRFPQIADIFSAADKRHHRVVHALADAESHILNIFFSNDGFKGLGNAVTGFGFHPRAGQVLDNRNSAADGHRGFADIFYQFGMVLVRAVGEIQARHIHLVPHHFY